MKNDSQAPWWFETKIQGLSGMFSKPLIDQVTPQILFRDKSIKFIHFEAIFCKDAVFKKGKRIIINIEDDGPGISEDQHRNVFKPFFRLDKSRSLNKSGVGLGLAIVEDVINSHGGSIQLGKSKYKGLQVKISLPF